ncbi:unnamed protein product [Brachionus calyciflorus]|uniref:XK-related protein n=2 Tax=Brachionus calyciflorus TaxID=104777 RepID=A0A813VBX0_9BILA|nr:unnamed protein product [Brachionus calyciflorus]
MLSSTSFAVFETNLDSCPKCGKNICEHASVADVINLPNSLSQDFSTYSSDSSLIKQLFNESTSSTVTNSTLNFEIDPKISLSAINELLLGKGRSVSLHEPEPNIPKKKKFRLFSKNRQLNCLSSSSSSSSSCSSHTEPDPPPPRPPPQSSSKDPKTYISVKLNNYYYYNYEKTVSKSSSSTASSTITDSVITEIHRPIVNITENRLDKLEKFDKLETTSFFSSDPKLSIYSEQEQQQIAKYHKITVIFILIGLFSFNFLQETFLIFHYVNSSQYYWFLYCLIGIFSGQCLTLLVSLLNELNFSEDKNILFKNPFSKLCLLIPGYLPLSCFTQFFKVILNYKRSNGQEKFRLEFDLSLLFYFNSLFYTLPLIIVNSCYLASNNRLNWYYTDLLTFSSDSAVMFIFNPESKPKNQFMILLVSIFISISIGLCLFITYYELMKQMRLFSGLKKFAPDTQWLRLGAIELLVYFCYKFCLITSRLSILALFWYLFNEWIILFITAHIFLLFTSTLTCVFGNNENEKRSKLNDLVTLKIICLLGIVDLFMNQTSELKNINRVLGYYLLNFMENSVILTYWLIKILWNEQAQQKICYTTLVYLSVLLFNVFGLILKYLHVHIMKKRYRKLFDFKSNQIVVRS